MGLICPWWIRQRSVVEPLISVWRLTLQNTCATHENFEMAAVPHARINGIIDRRNSYDADNACQSVWNVGASDFFLCS